MPKCELGFRAWARWAFARQPYGWSPPIYVRLWNGVMQLVVYRRVMSGASTPGHGERHRWWVDLGNPLVGGICWWCGLRCYPGPLLPYSGRPRWLFNRLRRWTRMYLSIRRIP